MGCWLTSLTSMAWPGAGEVLYDPATYRELGRRGAELIRDHYALDRTLPRLVGLFERTMSGGAVQQ